MAGSSVLPTLPTDHTASGALRRSAALLGEGFERPSIRGAYLIAAGSLLFLFPFGLVFNLTGVLIDTVPWTSSVYIGLIALTTLLSEFRARPPARVIMEFVALAAVLWAVEWVGVTTGVPFGAYHYTEVLGFLVAGVPLAIPCAWYATVMNSRRIAEYLVAPESGRSIGIALIAGVLTLALDLVLEPMAAMVKGYWLWSAGTVPLQNYLSWVVFTVISVVLLRRVDHTHRSGWTGLTVNAVMLFGIQWLLFVVTGAGNGHVSCAVVSVVLIAVLLIVRRRRP